MYISRVKAKGNFYFYAYIYDPEAYGKSNKRIVASLGKREKAAQRLQDWSKNKNEIPDDLKRLGLDEQNIDLWLEKVKAV